MSDKLIARGIHQMVNPMVCKQVNFEQLEQQFIEDGTVQIQEDPQAKFNEEMEKIMSSISRQGQGVITPSRKTPIGGIRAINLSPIRNDPPPMSGFSNMTANKYPNSQINTNYGTPNKSLSDIDRELTMANNDGGGTSAPNDDDDGGHDNDHADSRESSYTTRSHDSNGYLLSPGKRSELESKTDEQMRHEQVNRVMAKFSHEPPENVSITQERLEDLKTTSLDEIDALWDALTGQSVNLSGISKPTRNDSYDEIENIKKVLRIKHDRIRYCSLADEGILIFAHAVETVFNGKRVWFGKYKPNMKGWHKQVNVKLSRMRIETGTMVNNLLKDSGIGPLGKIFLELVPNGVMYAVTNTGDEDRDVDLGEIDRNIAAINDMK
jgi:hypothetical protein